MFTLLSLVGKGVCLLQDYFATPDDDTTNNQVGDGRQNSPDKKEEILKTTSEIDDNEKFALTQRKQYNTGVSLSEPNDHTHIHPRNGETWSTESSGTKMEQSIDCTSLESKENRVSEKSHQHHSSLTFPQYQDATSTKDSTNTGSIVASTSPDHPSPSLNFGAGFTSFGAAGDASLAQSKATAIGRCELGGNEAKVMVKNIPFKVKVSELRRFFGSFGRVDEVYLLKEYLKHKSRSKGMAFVTFSSAEGVKHVMAATEQQLTLRDRVLRIEYAEPKTRKQPCQIQAYNSTMKSKQQEQFEDAHWNDNTDHESTIHVLSDDALIHQLYDEILIKIFVLLDLKDRIRIERVCKRWYAVGRASWQSVESLTFNNVFKGFKFSADDSTVGLTDQILRSVLLRGCRNLLSLDLSASPHLLTYRSLELIGKSCPRLEYMNLTGVIITNPSLRQLSKSCNKLKTLILQRCLGVGEKGFWWLFHNCLMLEYIDFRESKRFRGKCFHILNSSCHTVIASGCNRLDDSSIYELTTKCTTHLKCLDISYCYRVTDKSLRLLGQNCTQLNKLDLSGLTQTVTPSGLCSLSCLTELTELHLYQTVSVNDEVLLKVGQNCRKLKFLDISACYDGVHDLGLQGLAGCMLLEVINFSYLDKVTDEGLKHLANSCSMLQKITARGCILLTDEGMLHLANQCTVLREVDVSGCEKLTNATLDSFLLSRQNVEETDAKLHLTVGGTEIETEYATQIEQSSNGRLVISTYNLAVAIKRLCTEAFFGSDDVSDEDKEQEEAVAATGEEWPDDVRDLPPDQFADIDAEMDQINPFNPFPAGYQEGEGQAEKRWDVGDDFVNDYLDADDPSMWDEEQWMLS